MKNIAKKYTLIILNLIIITTLVVSIYFNFNADTQYFCAIMKKVYTLKLVYITSAFFIFGAIFGYILNSILKSNLSQMFNAYQKRYESSSIEKDSDKAKIATLEAKIATLELALETALKNK